MSKGICGKNEAEFYWALIVSESMKFMCKVLRFDPFA